MVLLFVCSPGFVLTFLCWDGAAGGQDHGQDRGQDQDSEPDQQQRFVVVGLSSRNRLYCGETLLIAGASSLAVNAALGMFLFCTVGTRPQLHFVSIEALLGVCVCVCVCVCVRVRSCDRVR